LGGICFARFGEVQNVSVNSNVLKGLLLLLLLLLFRAQKDVADTSHKGRSV
jgi:hypothetical protein